MNSCLNYSDQDYNSGPFDRKALDPAHTDVPGPATMAPPVGDKASQDPNSAPSNLNDASKPAPNPGRPGNVLLYPMPPPTEASVGPLLSKLDYLQV